MIARTILLDYCAKRKKLISIMSYGIERWCSLFCFTIYSLVYM